ncbi:putative PAP-specific phosphatase, mitochondrial isoform X2 [Cucurbita maxima]|uniref:PAP-specific phosphatase, mitochondrial isoform X2 n=1 Tax=Cucurbita maxima TaxID=3661 RepID=A0A6J1ISU7_CUCMA|nr:putative PAP-specific phosphatase, mitochondrial isoform X2 [Cucurbita maxima]
MALLHSSSQFSSTVRWTRSSHRISATPRSRFCNVRSCLPLPMQNGKYRRELEAAVDVVQRACRLCVDVKSSLLRADGQVLEKNDQTPVTVADFGVQALVSLELGTLFPSIPLVAEEDSTFLRANNLAHSVLTVVTEKSSSQNELTQDDVLEAIDRGANVGFAFGSKPATYWVLDPIDGTRGFLRGNDVLYVVGLALVVEGEIVLGVMGCPNWHVDLSEESNSEDLERGGVWSRSGAIMIAQVGHGSWTRRLSDMQSPSKMFHNWTRCFVDECRLVHEARFCIPDSQTWESLPPSTSLQATTNADHVGNGQILLLQTCCGSLCKYFMVASGRASVFILRKKSQTIIKTWDHAVGMICVHEAGGKVTDWKGSDIDLAADQAGRRILSPSGGVLVTNGHLHDLIIEMTASTSSII